MNLLLEQLTSPDVERAIQAGSTTVVVACGAVEQHGPHLPLFMDSEHGQVLAVRVAEILGNALVAPAIRVGCSEHHMHFAGTVSLREATFRAICCDYAESLARHGFRHICFLPSHGGNFGPLERILPELNDRTAPSCRVWAFTDLQAQIDIWKRVVREEADLEDRVGGHADIAEASIMLVLHPTLVRQDRAVAGFTGELTPEILRQMTENGIHTISTNGILGDARGMSERIGRRCIEDTAIALAEHFRRAMASAAR